MGKQIKTIGDTQHERGFLVKTVHKVGNHSAAPELQQNLDTPTQGF